MTDVHQAEDALLGAAMLSPEGLVNVLATGIQVEDFHRISNQLVFGAITRLAGRGEQVDVVLVAAELDKDLTGAGGYQRLVSLIANVPSVKNAGPYANSVQRASHARKGVAAMSEAMQKIADGADPDIAYSEAEEQVLGFTNRSGARPIREIATAVLDELEAGPPPTVPTGFYDLDRLLGGGFVAGTLNTLSARPGAGKTSIAGGIAFNAARKGKRVVVLSLEMADTDWVKRELSGQAHVPGQDLHSMSNSQWADIHSAMDSIVELPIQIDSEARSLTEVITAIRRGERALGGVDLVIVDYLQLVHAGKPSDDVRTQISYMTRTLKETARRMEVAIVILAQLNRDVTKRRIQVPTMSDLKDSGSIEQDSDTVILLYRASDAAEEGEEPMPGETVVAVAKNRRGPIGNLSLMFNAPFTKFVNMTREVPLDSRDRF